MPAMPPVVWAVWTECIKLPAGRQVDIHSVIFTRRGFPSPFLFLFSSFLMARYLKHSNINDFCHSNRIVEYELK